MKHLPKILISTAWVLCCLLIAQESTSLKAKPIVPKEKPGKGPDLIHLRGRFTAAVGKDFDVVKDEFKGRSNAQGGGTY